MLSLWKVATLLGMVFSTPQQGVSVEISFCNFELPAHMKQVNASFNVSYGFQVDDEGRPVKILKLIDDQVGEKRVASCLANWRFTGIKKGVPIVAVFRWQHGEGWVALTIKAPAFSQEVKLTGERCPYLRMQSEKTTKNVVEKHKT
jgi:hypothetical protein